MYSKISILHGSAKKTIAFFCHPSWDLGCLCNRKDFCFWCDKGIPHFGLECHGGGNPIDTLADLVFFCISIKICFLCNEGVEEAIRLELQEISDTTYNASSRSVAIAPNLQCWIAK